MPTHKQVTMKKRQPPLSFISIKYAILPPFPSSLYFNNSILTCLMLTFSMRTEYVDYGLDTEEYMSASGSSSCSTLIDSFLTVVCHHNCLIKTHTQHTDHCVRGLETCSVADLKEGKALLINLFYFLHSMCSLTAVVYFLLSCFTCMISTHTTRGIGRYSNTLPPKMPLLVNGIHKDIYR